MAKHDPQPAGRSKIRVFFVDADLAPGDMQELTNALTSAIRPTYVISRASGPARIAAPSEGKAGDAPADNAELDSSDEVAQTEDIEQSPPSKSPSKPRKYRSPKVINDLDMNAGGKPFKDFALEKGNPSEHVTRYLIAAYWLAKYADLPAASVDHIATCYMSAHWTVVS